MGPIAIRKLGDGQRPVYANASILGIHAELGGGCIGGRMNIEQFAIIGQGLVAVSATSWNAQDRAPVCRQVDAMPVQESRRPQPQIDCDVEDFTSDARHQLVFRMWGYLNMHSA